MAQAQVAITAVDRTQSAINSASRGLQRLESSAAKLQSRFNLAFSLVTGGFIINGFNRLADAAAKTEKGSLGFAQSLENVRASANRLFAPSEGIGGATQAMKELNEALNDPSVVSAVNGIVDSMLTGFTKATTAIVKTAGTIRTELISLGALSAKTTEDQITLLEAQLAVLTGGAKTGIPELDIRRAGGPMMLDGGADIMAQRRQLEEQLQTLRESLLTGVEVTGRRRAVPVTSFYETAEGKMLVRLQEEMKAVEKQAAEMEKAVSESVEKMLGDDLEKVTADISSAAFDNLELLTSFGEAAAKNLQTAFANFLFDPFQNGIKGMLKGFVDMIRRMIAEIAASMILTKFFSWMSGLGGFWGSIGGAAVKSLTGKAMGGSVMGGTPYMVGERGPELFVPGSNGSIVPNDRMGGTTIAPVYNIDARGATADLQKALPGILQENNRRIFDELDRRYGIGR